MSKSRSQGIEYMEKYIGIPLCLVTKENLDEFIAPNAPIHPAFHYLSDVHKSDYMRIYLLHHYGGGWHDIKPTQTCLVEAWEQFSNPDVYLVGKPEIKGGAAHIHDRNGRWMPRFWSKLVATNRWVGKAMTPLSEELFKDINQLLDDNLLKLKKHPAKHAYAKKRNLIKQLIKMEFSNYPLQWTVFGNVFHPLNLKYLENIKRNLPKDKIENLGLSHR